MGIKKKNQQQSKTQKTTPTTTLFTSWKHIQAETIGGAAWISTVDAGSDVDILLKVIFFPSVFSSIESGSGKPQESYIKYFYELSLVILATLHWAVRILHGITSAWSPTGHSVSRHLLFYISWTAYYAVTDESVADTQW